MSKGIGIRALLERQIAVYDSALLTFLGVDGYDVYNCSVPFKYKGGQFIFGRVEKREEWANSHVRLFMQVGKDTYTVFGTNSIYELEDPYISKIDAEMVFGGTRVRKIHGEVSSYYGDFYRGSPERLTYFTSGPDNMKDIRTVSLSDGKVGVFSRPRTAANSSIGFVAINNIDELSPQTVNSAIDLGVLDEGTWGGVNQAYLLSSGKVGCVAHYSFLHNYGDCEALTVYTNFSFVMDPITLQVYDAKVIGTRDCYPPHKPKLPRLSNCAFSSGIAMRQDGKCDLYSGLGDTCEGRITIDYPFEGHGDISGDLNFSTMMQSSL